MVNHAHMNKSTFLTCLLLLESRTVAVRWPVVKVERLRFTEDDAFSAAEIVDDGCSVTVVLALLAWKG